MDRRKFLKLLGIAGAVSALPLKFNPLQGWKGFGTAQAIAVPFSPMLQKFIQPLPGLGGAGGIQVATSSVDPVFNIANGFPADADYYQIAVSQFTQQLHPSLPPTTLWGYRDATKAANQQTHLGGLVLARKDKPVRLRVTNELPPTHILPVDSSIPGAETSQAQNRVAVHLHGGFVDWPFDGGPFDWWTPAANFNPGQPYNQGASFTNGPGGVLDQFYQINYPGQVIPQGSADYWYPNQQSYRLMWYHDHALGITRLNAHAGIATGYLVLDAAHDSLVSQGRLPGLDRLIPLVFQDKIFVPEGYDPASDPGQRSSIQPGDIFYPSVYDAGPPAGDPGYLPLPVPSCVPEAFADTMLVNGVVYPFVEVEQRKYRLLMLNATNARFLRLRLVREDGTSGEPLGGYDTPQVGPPFVQIATEGGFLPTPVTLSGTTPQNTLLLGCAERAEVLVDFSAVPAGYRFLLYNDAPGPFPSGDPLADFYPTNPEYPAGTNPSTPGFGPNTRTIMEFRVKARVGRADRYNPLVLPHMEPDSLLPVPAGTYVRDLSLNESFDAYGRLIQYIGTNVFNPGTNSFGYPYLDTGVGERIPRNRTEVWRIANLTGDTHPMHIHLQNAQIVSRRPFDAGAYPSINYMGPAKSPDLNEKGWKETFRMNPDEVIEIIAKWELPAPFPGFPAIPDSSRVSGKEYVWHCHILEHEEHDMMHALVIDPPEPV
jgi:spore coat protein A